MRKQKGLSGMFSAPPFRSVCENPLDKSSHCCGDLSWVFIQTAGSLTGLSQAGESIRPVPGKVVFGLERFHSSGVCLGRALGIWG